MIQRICVLTSTLFFFLSSRIDGGLTNSIYLFFFWSRILCRCILFFSPECSIFGIDKNWLLLRWCFFSVYSSLIDASYCMDNKYRSFHPSMQSILAVATGQETQRPKCFFFHFTPYIFFQDYVDGFQENLNHQEIQVPKVEVLNLMRLFWGWVVPYISLTYSLYRSVPPF